MRNTDLIKNLKDKLKHGDEPISSMEGAFNGRDVLVVSAGPSSKDWLKVYESIKDADPIVVCIKQAIEYEGLSQLCNIHFFNPYNLKRYSYKADPLSIFTNHDGAPPVFNRYDLKFDIEKKAQLKVSHSLAVKRNFADYELSKTGLIRPFGPGIIHESVLFTLKHLGVNHIHIIGWDIALGSDGKKHFYDSNKENAKPLLLKVFDKLMTYMPKNYQKRIRYSLGLVYNKVSPLDGENNAVYKSMMDTVSWLQNDGIEVFIYGSGLDNKLIIENRRD